MKATAVILAAVLALQVNVLFAGNETFPVSSEITAMFTLSLAPATPAEATFEDAVTVDLTSLVPVIPAEATFEDIAPEMAPVTGLSPVTPAEADFEDTPDMISSDLHSLAPVTPPVADFE